MNKPKLSILIPSIPSRWARSIKLYNKIVNMIGDREIEVLMFTDNKKRTIGEKRESLKNISNGKYFMFVDDDDDLVEIEDLYNATFNDVDVITFNQRCLNADGSTYVINFKLGNPIEHNSKDGRYLDSKRPPFHVCAFSQKFKKYSYPFVSYGEDWGWLEKVLPLAKTEIHVDKVIHGYNFDTAVTEASTESNEIWKNPNHIKKEMKNKRKVIVNLSTGNYVKGMDRLVKSLEENHDTDFEVFTFTEESQVGAPLHIQNNYAFKVYAIDYLKNQGFDQILWLDASVVIQKSLKPIWDYMDEHGMFMEEAGHYVGSWCNEKTLKYFNITREEAMKMTMFAAGYCGFDFTNPVAIEFFAEWKESMLNGCFQGNWKEHRHDMTCASIIANKTGLNKLYLSGGTYFSYIGDVYGKPKETVIGHLIGL